MEEHERLINARCEVCIYAEATHRGDVFFCKRYAPRTGFQIEQAQWPIVEPHDWCGEFVKVPEGSGPIFRYRSP